tara:strand:+ start:2240 stop:3136 length:897 start_codon:yes stop_codon:yes gene_type:complete
VIKTLVESFLYDASRGKASLSPEVVKEFGESCQKAIEKQFNSGEREWRLRMSGVGKPLCQQQLEKKNIEYETEYNAIVKFLLGDLIEAMAIAILRGAGIELEKIQESVSLDIANIKLEGTYDVKIDGKIWDIKSASPASFTNKFGEYGGFERIKQEDTFGYVDQGLMYASGDKSQFGGWIAINKVTGEFAVCEAPDNQEEEIKESKKRISSNINKINKDAKFKKCFSDTKEIYKVRTGKDKGIEKETGNRILNTICGYCGYKKHCWPNAEMHPKITSRAKAKPVVWYSKLKTTEITDL